MKAYYRNDRRYEARVYYRNEYNKRKYHSFYGKTAESAINRALEYKNSVKTAKRAPDVTKYTGKLTVAVLTDEWFEYKKIVHKESTQSNYHTKADNHILPEFGNDAVEAIDHIQVNRYIRAKLDSGLSKSYIRSIVTLFKSILSYGVKTYGFKIKVDLIQLPPSDTREKAMFSTEEDEILLGYVFSHLSVANIPIIMARCMGMRIGEVCGLKWSDIDLDNQVIHVRRTVQRVKCSNGYNTTKVICGSPKSMSSMRDIAIPDHLSAVLSKVELDGNCYIATGTDKFIEPRTLQNRYKKLIMTLGLDYKSFHSLRHRLATDCFEKGIDDITISKILGHKSVEITRSIYIHSSLARQKEQIRLIDIPVKYIA